MVLSRKLIMNSFEQLFPSGITDPGLEPFKKQLLVLVVNEEDVNMSRKLGEIVAELARQLKGKYFWKWLHVFDQLFIRRQWSFGLA